MQQSESNGKGIMIILGIVLALGIILSAIVLPIIGIISGSIFLLGANNDTSLSEYGAEQIPPENIAIYQEAGEAYGIDWILLASIHKIETNFSQIKPMVSPVGAIGHFQFMPCTVIGWGYPTCQISSLGNANIPESALTSPSIINQYGGYGVDGNGDGVVDMFNIYDAAYTAANYLSSNMNGSDETEAMRNAIFAYNRADWYVEKVLATYFSYTNGLMLGGEAMAEVINGSAWVVPYSKNITSSFGVRNGRNHNGIDVASGGIRGKAIVAYADGVVTYSQFNNGGYGYKVDIDHGGAVTTHYAHMLEKGIPVGTEVKAGQVIGYVGNTGNVYSSSGGDGTHLHFEVRISGQPVDPMQYVGQFIN